MPRIHQEDDGNGKGYELHLVEVGGALQDFANGYVVRYRGRSGISSTNGII